MKQSVTTFIVPGLLLSLAAGQAFGAGFAIKGQSASSLGTAAASDVAGTQDISAIFSNPAAIGAFKGQNVSVGLGYVDIDAKFKEGKRTVPSFPALSVNDAATGRTEDDFTKPAILPAAFGVHEISEAINVGWSITAPFGTYSDYPQDWIGRYHGNKTDLKVINLDLGGSYKVAEGVLIGFGIQVQNGSGTISGSSNLTGGGALEAVNALRKGVEAATGGQPAALGQTITQLSASSSAVAKSLAQNYSAALGNIGVTNATDTSNLSATQLAALPTVTNNVLNAFMPAAEGKEDVLAEYEGSNTAIGFTLGVLYDPIENLRIGLSYRSQVVHATEGDISFKGKGAASSAYAAALPNGDAEFELVLPASIGLGVDYKVMDGFNVYFNATQTQWSSIEDLNVKYGSGARADNILVKLNWEDVAAYSLGAAYQLSPEFTVRLGFGIDESPTTDALRSPRSPDNDRTLIGLGGRYAGEGWYADLGILNASFKEPTLDLDETDYPQAQGDYRGNLSGKYSVSANTFMAQYGMKI